MGTTTAGFPSRFCFEARNSHGILERFLLRVAGRRDHAFRMRMMPRLQFRESLLPRERVSQGFNNGEQVTIPSEFLDGLCEFVANILVELPRPR